MSHCYPVTRCSKHYFVQDVRTQHQVSDTLTEIGVVCGHLVRDVLSDIKLDFRYLVGNLASNNFPRTPCSKGMASDLKHIAGTTQVLGRRNPRLFWEVALPLVMKEPTAGCISGFCSTTSRANKFYGGIVDVRGLIASERASHSKEVCNTARPAMHRLQVDWCSNLQKIPRHNG